MAWAPLRVLGPPPTAGSSRSTLGCRPARAQRPPASVLRRKATLLCSVLSEAYTPSTSSWAPNSCTAASEAAARSCVRRPASRTGGPGVAADSRRQLVHPHGWRPPAPPGRHRDPSHTHRCAVGGLHGGLHPPASCQGGLEFNHPRCSGEWGSYKPPRSNARRPACAGGPAASVWSCRRDALIESAPGGLGQPSQQCLNASGAYGRCGKAGGCPPTFQLAVLLGYRSEGGCIMDCPITGSACIFTTSRDRITANEGARCRELRPCGMALL
jgi:hypothetical protein